jgi:hypothetical protein
MLSLALSIVVLESTVSCIHALKAAHTFLSPLQQLHSISTRLDNQPRSHIHFILFPITEML